MTLNTSDIKVLAFDVFGTVVDWHGSIAREVNAMGLGLDGHAFASACHGAGRNMSRNQARKRWRGREVVEALAARGILIRGASPRGVAEEAPGAYKDVTAVVDAAEAAGLAKKVARLEPLVCIKG